MKNSPTWQNNVALMRHVINDRSKTDIEKLQTIIRTELFAVNSVDPEERRLSIEAMLQHFPVIGQEVDIYPEEFVSVIDGMRLSCDYVRKCWFVTLTKLHASTVLELGAGFGQVARIMLESDWCKKYVIIDLPESLWFAEVFLRHTLPNHRILKAEIAADLSIDCDVMLIPSHLAHHYHQPTDVFLNTSSLGEMTNGTAQFYLNLIDNPVLGIKKVVLLNRLMNTYNPRVESNREGESGWYFSLKSHWQPYIWELEPEMTRIPYEQQMHHRELLFVARRHDGSIRPHDLDPIRKQAWYSHPDNSASTRRSNQMFVDNNTACALFEAVRCNPTGENIDMLLRYLRSFGKRFPFEEEQFLARRYQELTGKPHPITYGMAKSVINQLTTKAAQMAWRWRKPTVAKNATVPVANGAHGDHATGSSLCLPHETKPR